MNTATASFDSTVMHRQWATRPADERFASLEALSDYLAEDSRGLGTYRIGSADLHPIVTPAGEIALNGRHDTAKLTHWSFGQLAQIAGAPADYLRTLPADLAVQNLEHGLARRAAGDRDQHKLYLKVSPQDQSVTVRALTSTGYTRIMTGSIVQRLAMLQQHYPTWRAPLVYPNGQFDGNPEPCVGFAGDRDAYICLVDDQKTIVDPDDGSPLWRGVMVINSEVGARRFDVLLFLCRYICGNFIIWGGKQLARFSMRHYGSKIEREWSRALQTVPVGYFESSAQQETELLSAASRRELGPGKPEVIDFLFDRRIASRKLAEAAYVSAVRYERNPRSAWGIVQGFTRVSQETSFADARVDADRAAAKVLDLVRGDGGVA